MNKFENPMPEGGENEVDQLKERLGKQLDQKEVEEVKAMDTKVLMEELTKRGIELPEKPSEMENPALIGPAYHDRLARELITAMEEEKFGPKPETMRRKGGSGAGSFVKDSEGGWNKL